MEGDSFFQICGSEGKDVTGGTVKGFTRSCTDASEGKNAVAVLVKAIPKLDENSKSSLKIRELQVKN